jgi:hypothetical protein
MRPRSMRSRRAFTRNFTACHAVDFMKREREEPILQATALVHEVYLKLIDVQNVALEGKAHFFAICAQMMRRILVDAAAKELRPGTAADWGGFTWTMWLI